MTDNTNGHGRGRRVPPLPTYTFPDSGITVQVRRIGLNTQQALLRAIAQEWDAQGDGEPQPPTVLDPIDYGDGKQHWMENDADPDYKARRDAWNSKYQAEYQTRLFKLAALECEVEVDHTELARVRRSLKAVGVILEDDPDLSAEENAKMHYFLHCAARTQEDLQEFTRVLLRRSQPTEEVVQEQLATFPDDV